MYFDVNIIKKHEDISYTQQSVQYSESVLYDCDWTAITDSLYVLKYLLVVSIETYMCPVQYVVCVCVCRKTGGRGVRAAGAVAPAALAMLRAHSEDGGWVAMQRPGAPGRSGPPLAIASAGPGYAGSERKCEPHVHSCRYTNSRPPSGPSDENTVDILSII